MDLNELLDTLGYADSENLLRAGDRALEMAPALGHVFRLAAAKRGLKAVYALRPPKESVTEPPVPIVYVCNADSDEQADKTHQLVWNQDVVPFVVINTPRSVRLYSGFRYRRRESDAAEGLLRALTDTKQVLELARTLGADAIDDGRVWRAWGNQIRPEARVDWQLLGNLRRLDDWLQKNGLEQEVSHALIGKYVYLQYLRHRDILSNRKLESWGITEREVFGREATMAGVERVIDHLDDWLNGRVFPLRFGTKNGPRQEHLRRVAATFAGDQPLGDGGWQLHLDFQAYDFSYIPIETLSVVYEQFLHSPSESATSRGKEAGAYYTPIPVVNFMLAEMEDRKPLRRGMRVLDPSCGSGAFLVQCYRRLIEREYPPNSAAPGPIRLRELLQEHIFGIDRDEDACSVTELSLILTLLDYVDPPDLENDKRVKLPTLRNQNIFCENFFANGARWKSLTARRKFDWLVGNPPWKKLNPENLSSDDRPAWQFIQNARKAPRPVGGNQLAQAFLWGASDCLEARGVAGFLIPAMTLFEGPSCSFRSAFLSEHQLQSVANFANLAEVLFRGRSKEARPRVASASVFFTLRRKKGDIGDDEVIPTYTPFVANQEPTRPVEEGTRQGTWSLVVNASEVRDVSALAAAQGGALPWKLAMWGSELDARLLNRIARKFEGKTLEALEEAGLLRISEGLQLRAAGGAEPVEHIPEVIGKPMLETGDLEELRHFFAFPANALRPIPEHLAFCRKGRARLPLSVCSPPHIIVSAARNFAIFSDEFVVLPGRQVGIASLTNDRSFLVALSLYLSSDFGYYQQFFTSSEAGIKRPRFTLSALRKMPVPVDALRGANARPWLALYEKLVEATTKRFNAAGATLFSAATETIADRNLLEQINALTYNALGLSDIERALVHDLVEVRLALDDGKLGQSAAGSPSGADIDRYLRQLKSELDGFVEGEVDFVHDVQVVTDEVSGLIAIAQTKANVKPQEGRTRFGDAHAGELAQIRKWLRRERSQWVYFDRNLRVYQAGRTLVLKPLQRVHWTVSQAIADAAEVIAGALDAAGEDF